MLYGLDLWNADKTPEEAIVPGWSSKDAMIYTNSPFPVPDVGETLEFHGVWKVKKRVFLYGYDAAGEPCAKVALFCTVVKEHERKSNA